MIDKDPCKDCPYLDFDDYMECYMCISQEGCIKDKGEEE